MNLPLSLPVPCLLPGTEESPGLTFHSAEGFAFPLLSFPIPGQPDLQVTALALHRPTAPEFLGSGWHLPMDRIVADFRRSAGKATLHRGGEEIALRQTGWSGPGEVDYLDARGSLQARFCPSENLWRVTSGDGLTRIHAASPRSAPRVWFLSEIREGEETLLRCAYHHGKVTQLLEMRDARGYCARFEHSPLRGNQARLLLRAVSVEAPKRNTLGRVQLSYAMHPTAFGQEPVLHSLLLREQGERPRGFRCHLETFPPQRARPRQIKSLASGSLSTRLFVPGPAASVLPIPHATRHEPVPRLAALRSWHEESHTVIVEQCASTRFSATRLTLYSRAVDSSPVSRRFLRRCEADLDSATVRFSRDQILIALPNRLTPGCFDLLLWRWSAARRGWLAYRRSLEADSLEILGPSADGFGLRISRQADHHTLYEYYWFDGPEAWCLTSMVPAPPARMQERRIHADLAEPEQETLFSRRSLPARPGNAAVPCGEDQIEWQPGELFAALEDDEGLILAS